MLSFLSNSSFDDVSVVVDHVPSCSSNFPISGSSSRSSNYISNVVDLVDLDLCVVNFYINKRRFNFQQQIRCLKESYFICLLFIIILSLGLPTPIKLLLNFLSKTLLVNGFLDRLFIRRVLYELFGSLTMFINLLLNVVKNSHRQTTLWIISVYEDIILYELYSMTSCCSLDVISFMEKKNGVDHVSYDKAWRSCELWLHVVYLCVGFLSHHILCWLHSLMCWLKIIQIGFTL